ncbi:MAG: paraslipin [Leptolyngbyaceae cyanobacterium SM2_5_2]|nr:paraslipin [Leptolyngbyaceae cyanobacterium SM2_5_2]
MPSQIIGILALIIIGYTISSVRIINEGDQALVERLGRFRRKLKPGLNFVVPALDRISLMASIREKILDVAKQNAITQDNVPLEVDAVVYWRIMDLERTYYAIENVEQAIQELVITTLRSEIGKMKFEETFSSRDELNRALLSQLDEATDPWGVKVTRVEVQEIVPPEEVRKSMQKQQAAELEKRATILQAEGEQEAVIKRTQATVRSVEMLSQVLQQQKDAASILQFLIAKDYVEANQKLGESQNSKVLFMDPKFLTEGLIDLMNSDTTTPENNGQGNNDDDFPSRRRRSS